MKRLLLLFVLALPLLMTSCVSEWDYEGETGTMKIPWGEKEGQRNPEEAYAS
jgi:hypothetical protein